MTSSLSGHQAAMAQLQADFPEFAISREITGDRVRYAAQRVRPGIRPHSVVTGDLDELRIALAGPVTGHQPAHDR